WHEPVVLPGTGRRIAEMMWSLGNVIRPNGEVLEGNAPRPAEYVPLTRANHRQYLDELVNRACRWLQQDTANRNTEIGS
ncbi:MAG: hypothetical protein HOH82_17935, partial [Planctomycetaceae bacterium]|nr:hypothetical protein [Planctomycetaceae bacterium]